MPLARRASLVRRAGLAALASAGLLAAAMPALAQATSGCAVVADSGPRVWRAALAQGEVGLTFVGHSTFVIETPGGVRAATDYNDYVRPAEPPDVATMNRAHSTHFTDAPDRRIAHVLRGWDWAGTPARHDVQVGDLRVRNLRTNIRDLSGGTDYGGNSIFVFEAAGLCIAHLGHLHHTLDPVQLAELGKVDVVLAPVDGSWTLDQAGMVEVLRAIGAPLVVPMHYFGSSSLDRFLSRIEGTHAIDRREAPLAVLTKAGLPARPTVMLLPGR